MPRDSGQLQWGKGKRPSISVDLTEPARNEGSDGDIQVRNTKLGERLFAKLGSKWLSTPLFDSSKVFSLIDRTGIERLLLKPDGNIILSPKATLSVKGNVGIGTTAPNYKLEVVGTHATDKVARIHSNNAGASTSCLLLSNEFSGNPGTGATWIEMEDADAILDEFQGDGSGGIQFTGTLGGSVSDSRIKTDIADLDSSLGKINSLQPRTFNFSNDFLAKNFQNHTIKDWQKGEQIGFIAQELGEVFPDMISKTDKRVQNDNISYDGKTVNTDDMIEIQEIAWSRNGNAHFLAHLVKAIQELSAKVDTMQTEINNLKSE